MKLQLKDIFGVEVDECFYHLDHVPEGTEIMEEHLITIDNKDNDYLYFCDVCKKQIG